MLSAVNSFANCYPMNTSYISKASFGSDKQADKSTEQNELPVITDECMLKKYLCKVSEWLKKKRIETHEVSRRTREDIYDSMTRCAEAEINLPDEHLNTAYDIEMSKEVDELLKEGNFGLKITQYPDNNYKALLYGKKLLWRTTRYNGEGSTIEKAKTRALDALDCKVLSTL